VANPPPTVTTRREPDISAIGHHDLRSPACLRGLNRHGDRV